MQVGGAGRHGRGDHLVDVQVGGRADPVEEDRLVRVADVGVIVGGVDRRGRHADGVHGVDDPDRDLSAIGHENSGHEHSSSD